MQNLISINSKNISITKSGELVYFDSIENFSLDGGPELDIPTHPWSEALYMRDIAICRFSDGLGEQVINQEWSLGNTIFEIVDEIVTNKTKRVSPPVDFINAEVPDA